MVCLHCSTDIEHTIDDENAVAFLHDHLMYCRDISIELRQVNIFKLFQFLIVRVFLLINPVTKQEIEESEREMTPDEKEINRQAFPNAIPKLRASRNLI